MAWNPGTQKTATFTSQKRLAMGKPADIKTKENDASVEDFINSVPDEEKRNDSFTILKMMQEATQVSKILSIPFRMKRSAKTASSSWT